MGFSAFQFYFVILCCNTCFALNIAWFLSPEFSRYELIELFSGEAITALKALVHEDHEAATLDGYLYVHLRYAAFRFKDCNRECENLDQKNYLGKEE